ncbi:F0F1 ATP synthase subunit delta [Facklamia hominis]|uniref:F0F1 ATP synthase subunit delta n=1 Tax=Facklamia hominis TaxID=178214 RepID=UPI0038FD3531
MNKPSKRTSQNLNDLELLAASDNRSVQYEDDLLEEVLEELGLLPLPETSEDEPVPLGDRVFLTSAIPLEKNDKIRILKEFIRITKQDVQSFITIVDPSLIIGLRIQSERFYYDLSGQNMLHQIKEEIKNIQTEEVIE